MNPKRSTRRINHNLADFKEFMWPMAPTVAGTPVDMRVSPTVTPVMDQTTSLMDPSRRLAFVTALHRSVRRSRLHLSS